MEGQELIAFQIISSVGSARSSYIEAIHKAKVGEYDAAEQLIKDGDTAFLEGHGAHAKLLTDEANQKAEATGILLMHAEDQMMAADAFKTIALEFISVYHRLDKADA